MIDLVVKVLAVWIVVSVFLGLGWVALVELSRVWFHWQHERRQRARGGYLYDRDNERLPL